MQPDALEKDLAATLANRKNLLGNKNLLYWYEKFFAHVLADQSKLSYGKILEIGSGASPLQHFFPQVKTSDVLPLPYLDYTFDALEIDRFTPIKDESLDLIILTNVLHHLEKPLDLPKQP